MRMIGMAILLMTGSAAIADEIEDAHKRAVIGRDAYWNCLAREYPLESNKAISLEDFESLIATVCPSERQNLRSSLVDFLSLRFPDVDVDAHMTTANRAVDLAQMDIVTAFAKRRAAAK